MNNIDKYVTVHYRGTLATGEEFDNSYKRAQPLSFNCGSGEMIPGFDDAVKDMKIGEKKTVTIAAKDAYGERDPTAVTVIPATDLPHSEDLPVGETVLFKRSQGSFPAKVVYVDAEKVILDLNHRLAGEDLTFDIELIDASDQKHEPESAE